MILNNHHKSQPHLALLVPFVAEAPLSMPLKFSEVTAIPGNAATRSPRGIGTEAYERALKAAPKAVRVTSDDRSEVDRFYRAMMQWKSRHPGVELDVKKVEDSVYLQRMHLTYFSGPRSAGPKGLVAVWQAHGWRVFRSGHMGNAFGLEQFLDDAEPMHVVVHEALQAYRKHLGGPSEPEVLYIFDAHLRRRATALTLRCYRQRFWRSL